jgi:hypothetical protein
MTSAASRIQPWLSIPPLPDLTYSSSEDSSSEPDLSPYGAPSGRISNILISPVLGNLNDSRTSQLDGGRQLGSSHQQPHRRHQRTHNSVREQQNNPSLHRSVSTPTGLRKSKSSSSLKRRHHGKGVFFPHGQTVHSLVPLSFSGTFDEDGEPVFVDECKPRASWSSAPTILAKSTPLIPSTKDKTPSVPIVLHPALNMPQASQHLEPSEPGGSTQRTLTIFDTFSFPLPPASGMHQSPIPRSPGHRATASEGLIRLPLHTSTAPPVPKLTNAQQNIQPLRTNSCRHGTRPLPPLPPPATHDSSRVGGREPSLRSASAAGIGESESGLNLNGALRLPLMRRPSEDLPRSSPFHSDKGRGVDEVVLVADRSPIAFRSARSKDSGIDSLIGMLDAAM